MNATRVRREEQLRIGAPPRILEAVLTMPAGPPRAAAVVCHPHPRYGGDMENPVVQALGRALVDDGVAVLRFNFGGVGRSGCVPGGGPAEVGDVHAALAALAARLPALDVVLAGYSFGAWAAWRAAADGARAAHIVAVAPPIAALDHGFVDAVAVPTTVIVGDRDEFCPAAALDALVARHPRLVVHRLAGADHFLVGREGDVAALAPAMLRTSFPAP